MVDLSGEVRAKTLFAFVEIPAGFLEAVEKAALVKDEDASKSRDSKKKKADEEKDPGSTIHFYAMTSSAQPTTGWLEEAINEVAASGARRRRCGSVTGQANDGLGRSGQVRSRRTRRRRERREGQEVDDLERIGLPMFVSS
jgi:hypothetical protein